MNAVERLLYEEVTHFMDRLATSVAPVIPTTVPSRPHGTSGRRPGRLRSGPSPSDVRR